MFAQVRRQEAIYKVVRAQAVQKKSDQKKDK